MQPKRPLVSVVIPTLNESPNLPLVLPYLPLSWIDEVIIVDGRSTDNTIEIARRLLPSIRVVLETKPGKGAAMLAGFKAARGDIIVTMDADGSNDPREIPRMVQSLLEGSDFVKGSRFAPGGGTTDMPRYRKWGNRALGGLTNLLFNGTYTDLCYGYHAFWRHCLAVLETLDADGFEIDTAIYILVLRNRLRVSETPSFEGYRFHGIGKLQTLPDGWRILKTILSTWVRQPRDKTDEVYRGFRGFQPAQFESRQTNEAMSMSALEVIYALTHEIAAEPDPHKRLVRILGRIQQLVGATGGSLLLIDQGGQVTNGVMAFAGQFRRPTPAEVGDVFESGLAGWVLEHRQPALIPNTLNDTRWLKRSWEGRSQISRSAVSVPLALFDRLIGVLTLVTDSSGQFTERDLALLATIAVGLSLSAAGFILPEAPHADPLAATSRRVEHQPALPVA
jgi:glycosyltransferase involved in cell wall biosynthesis